MKYSNKLLVELLILFVLATFAAGFFYVAKVFVVSGNSMHPTLKNHERILIDKRAYIYVDPIKSDIVGMVDPKKPDLQYIKRVVACPGDLLVVNSNEIKVNDIVIDKENEDSIIQNITVPKGYFFVMGDNRPVSYDSRDFGLVPKGDILGKAIAVIWPLANVRFIK
jgi:signal peptidase I